MRFIYVILYQKWGGYRIEGNRHLSSENSDRNEDPENKKLQNRHLVADTLICRAIGNEKSLCYKEAKIFG